uniref:DUF148 domain-containing protein n=1 Tax=Panagrellus redivivus TaxID=6233 RepID=A0A7E4VGP5_PANRE
MSFALSHLIPSLILCVVLTVSISATAEHDKARVAWVPVMERRTEVASAIGDALKEDAEKTARISKMLNSSLANQEKTLAEGKQKLHHVLQATHAQQTRQPSSSTLSAPSAFFVGCLFTCLRFIHSTL